MAGTTTLRSCIRHAHLILSVVAMGVRYPFLLPSRDSPRCTWRRPHDGSPCAWAGAGPTSDVDPRCQARVQYPWPEPTGQAAVPSASASSTAQPSSSAAPSPTTSASSSQSVAVAVAVAAATPRVSSVTRDDRLSNLASLINGIPMEDLPDRIADVKSFAAFIR